MLPGIVRALAPAAVALLLTGCPGFGDETLEQRAGVDGTPTWEGGVRDVFRQQCWACHGQTPCCDAPNSLFTYEQAFANRGLIEDRVVVQNAMPPGVGLPDGPRGVISAWLKGGAPEGTPRLDMGAPDAAVPDAGTPDVGPAPDAGGTPTWVHDVGPLFANRCATPGCHVGSFAQGGLDLSTYAGFTAGGISGDLTGGGDPEASLLVGRLRGTSGNIMPQGGDPFTEAQIRLVSDWIAAGAPEGP
jgi:hypothetical protein